MKSFKYSGVIPASKSIMNRALICASHGQKIKVNGDSSCDDVVKMQNAVKQIITANQHSEQVYDCGAAGTVLRFLSMRLSRIPGRHILVGTERLMQRPQQDLLDLFDKLEVKHHSKGNQLILDSKGWMNLDRPIQVHRSVSSQFASGIILNSWNLESPLRLVMTGDSTSEGYLEMTLDVVKDFGMQLHQDHQVLTIEPSQPQVKEFSVESDLSSLFAVAAYAVLNGVAEFQGFKEQSIQPDVQFLEFFNQMKIRYEVTQTTLKILDNQYFQGLEANLNSCPDLFPVLAVLCSQAQTPSRLFGAPQLVHKESNRIQKISELLKAIKVDHTPTDEGMLIKPSNAKAIVPEFTFDTDHDHRLAFAASLVRSLGYPIKILHPEVVSKSFPEYWSVIQS